MSYRLLHDLILENNGFEIIKEGTILDLDNDVDQSEKSKDDMMEVIQDWINKYKKSFGSNWSKIINFLQPAIDAIHDNDVKALKSETIRIANKSEQLSKVNPKAKEVFERIHNLYIRLLGMARGAFGESIDEMINIIKECNEKINII